MLEKEEKICFVMLVEKYYLLFFIVVYLDYQLYGFGYLLMWVIDSVLFEYCDLEGVGVFVIVFKYEIFFFDGFY